MFGSLPQPSTKLMDLFNIRKSVQKSNLFLPLYHHSLPVALPSCAVLPLPRSSSLSLVLAFPSTSPLRQPCCSSASVKPCYELHCNNTNQNTLIIEPSSRSLKRSVFSLCVCVCVCVSLYSVAVTVVIPVHVEIK